MDQRSDDYGYREGGSDVERTLMMVASGVVGGQNDMADVRVNIHFAKEILYKFINFMNAALFMKPTSSAFRYLVQA